MSKFIKNHFSYWFSNSNSYPLLIREDFFIREFLRSKLTKCESQNIQIERKLNLLIVTILVPKSSLNQFLKTNDIHSLREKLFQHFPRPININQVIVKVSELPENDSVIQVMSNYISDQLKKRVPFRRVMRNAILKVKKMSLKGIKVQISGRLNGAEIARTEWVREGSIPLHTIDANISYLSSVVLVIKKQNFGIFLNWKIK